MKPENVDNITRQLLKEGMEVPSMNLSERIMKQIYAQTERTSLSQLRVRISRANYKPTMVLLVILYLVVVGLILAPMYLGGNEHFALQSFMEENELYIWFLMASVPTFVCMNILDNRLKRS